ncbi:MAG: TetR/AcrR family transcriptional regulator [Bdellovibrionales bacterium]
MGRQIEFDTQNALNKAMRLFWRKGYSSVSLKELLGEMEILNGSFYNSFGSKQSVFIAALKNYVDGVVSKRLEIIGSKATLKEGLGEYFKTLLESCEMEDKPKGCMFLNLLSGGAKENAEATALLQGELKKVEDYLLEQVVQAKKRGEFFLDVDERAMALLIITYIKGLTSMDCIGRPVSDLRGQAQIFINSVMK